MFLSKRKCVASLIAITFFLLGSLFVSSTPNAFTQTSTNNRQTIARSLSSLLSREEVEQSSSIKANPKIGNFSSLFKVQVTAIHVDRAEFPLSKLLFKLALKLAERSLNSKRIKLALTVRSASTCSRQYAGAIAAEEYYLKGAHLFIVSGCDDAIRGISRLASSWSVPVMTAAGFGPDLNDKLVHPTLVRVAFSLKTAVKFLKKILKSFLWRRVNLIVDESDPNSLSLKDSIDKHLLETNEFDFNLNVISFELQSLLTNRINYNSSTTPGNTSSPLLLDLPTGNSNNNKQQQQFPYHSSEDKWSNEAAEKAVRDALRQSSLFSRVNILLIPQGYLRKFMLSVYDENMANGLYTFINVPLLLQVPVSQQTTADDSLGTSVFTNLTPSMSKQSYSSSTGDDAFIWRSTKSTRNSQAKQAFESLMSIYLKTPTTKAYLYFSGNLLSLANSEYAITTTTTTQAPSANSSRLVNIATGSRLQLDVNPYTASFYDCIGIYAKVLEEALFMSTNGSTARELNNRVVQLMKNRRFDNMATGSIFMNKNGDRDTDYTLDDLNPITGKFSPVILFKGETGDIERIGRIHWSSDDSIGPTVDNIDCALLRNCPRKPWSKFMVTLMLISAPVSLIMGLVLYFVYTQIRLESQLVDYWWKISYKDIELLESRHRQAGDGSSVGQLENSLVFSANKTKKLPDEDCTDISDNTNKKLDNLDKIDSDSGGYNRTVVTSVTKATDLSTTAADVCYGNIQLGLYKLAKVSLKPIVKLNQTRRLMIELRTIKNITHSNLCRFVGIILEANPTLALVSEFCPKGSLREFFQTDSMVIDWTFKYSIINDVFAGLSYLHSSPLQFHGRLKASNCLVSSRFVVKLSDYGLQSLYEQLDEATGSENEVELMEKKIWLAPEHMRLSSSSSKPAGSVKGDVYSFGLLLFEILTNKIPFRNGDDGEYSLPIKSLYGELKSNGISLEKTGPDLNLVDFEHGDMEVLVHFMKRAWSFEPSKRPSMQEANSILRRITKGVTSKKLLENLTSRMEQYTNNLESLVEAKLATLLEEKQKTEELLYQFVPKSVALLLKDGHSVEPEAFDCVTVFFSDIVGFTSLSSDSSPMEVIDFLSDLYLCFDETLQHYDIFKVDTIGDAYIVASGLPQRNEGKHVIEIARAALELRERISNFKIPHKPERKLEMRVGINSGPCVAGIVGGLNMPKYCVFGDTLTTGKFMESSGLPMKIHVTEESKALLEQVGGFKLEPRTNKISKDGLPMQTYWLEGELNR